MCAASAGSIAQALSPYAGQQSRTIKALSAEEIDGYISGKGMGFAKAAELNGFPGPMHVLELDRQLGLTADQRERTMALYASMQSRASALGRALVDEESRLDQLFATRAITLETMKDRLNEIAALQGKIRAAHLEAHLAQAAILTTEQVERYAALRGYAEAHGGHDKSHRH
jgi:Spy/CpxP family protein refolding chaperone